MGSDKRDLLKSFATLYTPVFALISVLFLALYNVKKDADEATLKIDSKQLINYQRNLIHYGIDATLSDLYLISEDSHALSALSGDKKSLEIMADTFIRFNIERRRYDQMRLLNRQGMEILRVNYSTYGANRVDRELLQNKASRYYFKDTLAKPSGHYFISPMDINMEQGQIEVPFKPMIRFGAPIYNDEGTAEGTVILNYLGSIIIDSLGGQNALGALGSGEFSLMNKEGYWLYHSDESKRWGFMFPEKADEKFCKTCRESKDEIWRSDEGQFMGAEGLYTYATIHLKSRRTSRLDEIFDSSMPTVAKKSEGIVNGEGASGGDNLYWKLVYFVPDAKIASLSKSLLYGLGLIFIIVSLMSGFITWSLAKNILTLRLTKAETESKNSELNRKTVTVSQMNMSLKEEISHRKMAERIIAQREREFRNLFQQAPVALLESNAKDGSIATFNSQFVLLVGYSEKDVSRKTFFDFFPPGATGIVVVNTIWSKVVNGESVREAKAQIICKDGSRIWVSLSIDPIIGAQGKVSKLRIALIDISGQHRIEEMKNEFVSTVSHELRTPLTSILGSLGLIDSGLMGDIPEKTKNLVTIAKKNTERLVRLINDILDIEKIEAGEMSFTFEQVDLSELIPSSVGGISSYAHERGVEIAPEIKVEKDESCVWGDKDRLEQVLVNLLSNAIKFSPKGSVVSVVLSDNDESLTVEVLDRGAGIPLKSQGKIFQRFAQADSSDNRQVEGTGLGLSISKVIVEHHEGDIGFKSKEGQGATFYFTLPKSRVGHVGAEEDEPSSTVAKEAKPDAMRRMPAILHVEDDEGLQLVTLAALDNWANVTQAASVEEAKEKFDNDEFDAVILDMTLPDGSGSELIPLFNNSKQKTAIVIFSNSEPTEEIKLKVDMALIKSKASSANLVEILRQLLNEKSFNINSDVVNNVKGKMNA